VRRNRQHVLLPVFGAVDEGTFHERTGTDEKMDQDILSSNCQQMNISTLQNDQHKGINFTE
jgi:hypothetical protein